MRRIYYSSNFFRPTNISCFRYLRILSFSYYSVIKVQIHCLTSERCHRSFQEHRSLFNLFCFLTQNDPAHTAGSLLRPNFLRCILRFYVSVPFNKFSFTPIITFQPSTNSQWRWRDLNPRPSPCKGAALPLSYIPRTGWVEWA